MRKECASIQYVQVLVSVAIVFILVLSELMGILCFNFGTALVLGSARKAPDEHRLASTQRFFERAKQHSSSLPRLYYWQGQAYYVARRPERALRAWRAFPDADYWLTMRGRVLLKQGRSKSAEDILTMASELNPGSSTIYYYGGLAFYRSEQYDEALAWYTKALDLDAFDERFVGNPSKADVWWPARPDNLTRDPTPAMTYIQMSAVHYQLGQWDLMQAAAQSAIDIDPDEPLGYFQLGCAYYRWAAALSDPNDAAELYGLAEDSFIAVADQVPDYQYPYFLILARLYVELGDISAATSAYQRVLRTSSQVSYEYEVARFYAATGQVEASLPLYESVLAQTAHEARFGQRWIDAAEAYWMASEQDVACTLYRQGVEICGNELCSTQNSMLQDTCLAN